MAARALHSVAHAQAVDYRAQHAHMIGGHSVHLFGLAAAPDIARADDHAQLHAGSGHIGENFADAQNHILIEQPAVFAQSLAAELKQDALGGFLHD